MNRKRRKLIDINTKNRMKRWGIKKGDTITTFSEGTRDCEKMIRDGFLIISINNVL